MNPCCFDSQKYFQTMIQIAEEIVLRNKPSSDVQTGGSSDLPLPGCHWDTLFI